MKLTAEQQEKVEKNIGLVYKVIQDKVHGSYQTGVYTFEDYVQIGCIGLCKAAATDRGGTFSTYAYRLIWNEICHALIYSTRRRTAEAACEATPFLAVEQKISVKRSDLHMDLAQALRVAKQEAPPSTAKGMEAICMMVEGYTSREIGEKMNASANLVCAWVSKARKFLKARPEFGQFAAAYCVGK